MTNLRSRTGLQQFVEGNVEGVAFLRFARGGLKQNKYSDWDIAVRDREASMKACETLYGEPWLRIPRRYVCQHYYSWGQCDLLPVFEWNGIEYLDQDLFWEKVHPESDGIPRPDFGHDAYITWMTGLLWGRRFNRRYQDFVQQAARESTASFRECLDTAFGKGLGERLYLIAERGDAAVATHWVREMRLRIFVRRFVKAPLITTGRILKHWKCEWSFHRFLPMPWVGILGPDGSGKSTVIELINERLRKSRLKLKVIHWLPGLSSHSVKSTGPVTDPHSVPAKSAFLSILQLVKIFTYWWWASFKYIFHLRAKREMVLSDRFYLDLLADPKRYRYGAPLSFARFVFRFLPKPDRIVVLHTEAEVILARKQEVTEDELRRQLEEYAKTADDWKDRATLVDCGRSPDEVSREVVGIILSALKERSR